MAHAQGARGIKNAVRAGIRSIEHGIYLDPEAIDLMLEAGTFLVPTLVAPRAVIAAAEAGAAIPTTMVEKASPPRRSTRDAITARPPPASGRDGHRPRCRAARLQPRRARPDGRLRDERGAGPRRLDHAPPPSCSGLQDVDRAPGPGYAADLVLFDGDLRGHDLSDLGDRVVDVWQGGTRVPREPVAI